MGEGLNNGSFPTESEQLANGDMVVPVEQLSSVVEAVKKDIVNQPKAESAFAAPDPSKMFGADHETASQVADEAAILTEEAIAEGEVITPTLTSRNEFKNIMRGDSTGNRIISTNKISQARDIVSSNQSSSNNEFPKNETAKVYNTAVELAQSKLAEQETDRNTNPWDKVPGANVEQVVNGVFLGNNKLAGNSKTGYVDKYYQAVPAAGIAFGVEQASYGYTGISAKPLNNDVKVEALQEDEKTKDQKWASTDEVTGDVKVTSDWGKMSELPYEEWANNNLGKEGGRAGIVRVTDKAGNQKYYVLGADFKGEPDNWRVTAQMVEVYPKNMPALTAQKLGLPTGSEIKAIESSASKAAAELIAKEDPLSKAKRLFGDQSKQQGYDNLYQSDPETEAAINSLNDKDRRQFDQWMVDRSRRA